MLHTKWPWIAREHDGLIQITSDVAARNIANIEWHNGLDPVDYDNSKVLAAAPELLEALKAIIQHPPVLEVLAPRESLGSLLAFAEAAIAKAEGR